MSSLDWAAIRNDYEKGLSLRALAAKYGVSKTVIGERKYKEQWEQPQRTSHPKQKVPNRDVSAALRAADALRLRAQKLTYQQIADACGYSDASTCRKAILRELDRVVVENANELRREEGHALDIWQAECSELFFDKKNTNRLFALDRLLAISRDRRALYNLDKRPEEELTQQNYIKRIVLVPPTLPLLGGESDDTNG